MCCVLASWGVGRGGAAAVPSYFPLQYVLSPKAAAWCPVPEPAGPGNLVENKSRSAPSRDSQSDERPARNHLLTGYLLRTYSVLGNGHAPSTGRDPWGVVSSARCKHETCTCAGETALDSAKSQEGNQAGNWIESSCRWAAGIGRDIREGPSEAAGLWSPRYAI